MTLKQEKAPFWVMNNNGADQPVHPCSLIGKIVVPILKNIISRLATSIISNF